MKLNGPVTNHFCDYYFLAFIFQNRFDLGCGYNSPGKTSERFFLSSDENFKNLLEVLNISDSTVLEDEEYIASLHSSLKTVAPYQSLRHSMYTELRGDYKVFIVGTNKDVNQFKIIQEISSPEEHETWCNKL